MPEFKIVNDEAKRDIKRTVEVALKEKLTNQQLESIATTIYKDGFERTFISYKIEGDTSSIKWAVSNYDPYLDINIIGSTKEEDSLMAQNAKYKTPGELLSAWKGENDMLGSIYALSKKNDNILFTQFWKDGGILTDTIVFEGDTFDMGNEEYGQIYDDGSLGFYSYEHNRKFAHLKHIHHLDSIQ